MQYNDKPGVTSLIKHLKMTLNGSCCGALKSVFGKCTRFRIVTSANVLSVI